MAYIGDKFDANAVFIIVAKGSTSMAMAVIDRDAKVVFMVGRVILFVVLKISAGRLLLANEKDERKEKSETDIPSLQKVVAD